MIAIVFVVITKTLWTEVLRRLAPNSHPPMSSLLKATGATVADDEDVDSGGVEQLNLNFF